MELKNAAAFCGRRPAPPRFRGRTWPLAFVAFMLATLGACDARPQGTAAAPLGIAPEKLATASLESWADEAFGQMLEEHRISALAISVTHGDEVLFKKGYGYADWTTRTPVDPDVSQFRIGSLTKTFFGTAIAQLLERGDIDSLDDPINKYLTRIDVDNPFREREITIWDMLTHQGGMGSASVFSSMAGGERPQPPLPAAVVEAKTPSIVREPGTLSIYCNPCSATLGFMVEDITGQTLESYLQDNVYEPLGMAHTTLVNSLEAPGPHVVTQYAFASGEPPVALPYPSIAPYISYAGDINSTAGDMARFIKAHIMEGEGTGAVILRPETARLMHARKRGNHPDASGFGMQFFTYEYNGERVIEHYGSIQFRSLEIMMLDSKVGVFVTMAGGGSADPELLATANRSLDPVSGPVLPAASHSGVRALILEHFLGPLPIPEGVTEDVTRYTGLYHSVPRDQGDDPGGRGRMVQDSGDGGLIIGDMGVYRPVGSGVFVLDGPLPLEAGFGESNRYVFAPGPDGDMRMYAHVNAGAFEREEASAP